MNLYEASNQWATRPSDQRFETLESLRDSVHARRMLSRSVDVDMSRVKAVGDGKEIILNGVISPVAPSYFAFGQLASAIQAPAGYLRTLPTDKVVDLVNYGLTREGNREANKFMTIERPNSETGTLQAVTSTKYGRIWDADVVDAVMRVVERSGGKFHNPKEWSGKAGGLYASDHDVFCFLIDGGSILDAGPRAQLNRGFITWNSETGARTFGLMTFLFNFVCGNHIIWGAQDVNKLIIRHTSGGPYRFDSQAAPTLKAYCESSEAPIIETVRKAQDMLLPEKREDLESWVNTGKAKFTRKEVAEAVTFAKSEEGDCRTIWQLVQGFTAYARGFDYIDARVDLEKRAGTLLQRAV